MKKNNEQIPLEIEPYIQPEVFSHFQTLSLERKKENLRNIPALEFKNVVKKYDNKTVIPDLSFKIDDIESKTEIISIIGPSGCGKSTVLKLIAGLEKPTEGEIFCSGNKVLEPDKNRGMIFQKYSSFPFLTVLENIAYPLIHVRKMLRQEAFDIASYWVKKLYLSGAEKKYPHQLSGGMQQRLAIARSLCMDTKILLMDEPFGALDRKIRWEMQDMIAELAFFNPEREYTIIIVTHDIPEAVYLGDRIWLMYKGLLHKQEFSERPTEGARKAQFQPHFLDIVNFFNEEIDKLDLSGEKK